jgi:type 2 lantibiotic biosynthesis protein LanM
MEEALATRRMKRWGEQPPFPSGSYFEQRLAADGLGRNHLLYCLGEPAATLQKRLGEPPDWLAQLAAQFSASPSPAREFPQAPDAAGFLAAIDPMIQNGLKRVEQYGNTTGERFQSFLARLRRPEIALVLLREYPVLARQLALRINQWAEFSLEFLGKLAADWRTIQTSLGGESDPGMLDEVTGGAGDRHRGGRSVVIAKFSSGLRIVYKPRSLSVDVHFQELLEWLNARAGWAPFRTLRVLDRGEYGWVEYVAAQGCSSTAELTRFYERQGAYLAVLFALEATDFHFENLIAAGEHPVLPDLEALFHPRTGAADLRQAEALAGNAIAHSVARVGLLPQLGWGAVESAGVDLSGLGSVEGQLTPRPVPQWEGEGTDEMCQVRKRVEMPAGHNRPALDGVRVDVLEYAE